MFLLLLTWVAAAGQELDPVASSSKRDLHLDETKIVEDIIEPKLSGSALAGLYRRFTGRRVIVSAAAATAEFYFFAEAGPQHPLTYDHAAELVKKAATAEKFVFLPHKEDHNLYILTLASRGIRAACSGFVVYNENDSLPAGDPVITYVMNLRYVVPSAVAKVFYDRIGKLGAYTSIAAVPNAPAVVITGKTSTIRILITLKKVIPDFIVFLLIVTAIIVSIAIFDQISKWVPAPASKTAAIRKPLSGVWTRS